MKNSIEKHEINYRLPHFEKFYIIIDRTGKPIQVSADKQAMVDICESENGLKQKYRLLETHVTKINIFGAFSGEKTF